MAIKPRKILNLCIMATATQQYVIPVITNSRRRKNQRFTMSANCLNKNYKLNRRNLIKIQVTQKFQNTSAGIVSNIPNCSGEKMKSLPNVMVANARSVYNKLNELEILVDNNNSDIVFLTETWLTDNILDEAINILGTNLVRLERKHGTGGGVALLINSKIPFKVRDDLYMFMDNCSTEMAAKRDFSDFCLLCLFTSWITFTTIYISVTINYVQKAQIRPSSLQETLIQ